MRYIDKYPRHTEALAINVRFLRDCYSYDINAPIPSPDNSKSSYEGFKQPVYRDGENGWENILLDEQTVEGSARCCYCMRKLKMSEEYKGKINFEHIVPRALCGEDGQQQFEYYSSNASALNDHVILSDRFCQQDFTSLEVIKSQVKMPHTTALSNLVVACNGKRDPLYSSGCCCNSSRGDDKMLPIVLMPNADTDVKYDANGILSISCNDGTLDKIIKELNDETLQEIRAVWFHLSKVSKDISTISSMTILDRINWFKEAYQTANFETLPESVRRYIGRLDSKDDTYWKLLLAYDWFYYYSEYAQQRAIA